MKASIGIVSLLSAMTASALVVSQFTPRAVVSPRAWRVDLQEAGFTAEQTAALMRAEGRPHPALETDIATLRAEVASIGDGVQVEVSVGQQGPSAIGMVARCQAGGHRALCQQLLQPFKQQLGTALEERWPGCSPSVTEEGVPPEPELKPLGADFEPEPEPEPMG